MKNVTFLAAMVILCPLFLFSQQDTPPPSGDDPTSTVNYFEIKNSRINFFSVNNRYKCIDPTIYYIDRTGFIINPGWDSVQIGNDWYIILTYPAYINKGKDSVQDIPNGLRKEVDSVDLSKSTDWERVPLKGRNGLLLMIKKSDFDQLAKAPLYSTAWRWNRLAFSSGQLTVPFKLRPAIAGKSFSMTTDVTIGAYAGIKKRISKRQNFFVTLPFVAGLTLINVNDNTTSASGTVDRGSGVVPGWTIATGLVAQLNSFNIGVVTGWDFASDVGKSWIYQGETMDIVRGGVFVFEVSDRVRSEWL